MTFDLEGVHICHIVFGMSSPTTSRLLISQLQKSFKSLPVPLSLPIYLLKIFLDQRLCLSQCLFCCRGGGGTNLIQ